MYHPDIEFSSLIGKTLTEVRVDDDEIVFVADDGTSYKMYHSQDCCESVDIEDITGDLQDLVGSPIIRAEENSNNDTPDSELEDRGDESYTWTFYRISTAKGLVVIRWYGSSNGYYSEAVSFCKVS